MREIKFRAWEEKGKDMIYSHRGNFVMELDGECSFVEWGHNYFKPMPDLILMQFTGLKDKNEKEIYEGDILKITRVNWYCPGHPENNTDVIDQVEIYWDEEKNGMFSRTFDFERLKRNPNQRPYCSSGSLGSGWNDERADENIWEVIGNIYENPELTKHDALHENDGVDEK